MRLINNHKFIQEGRIHFEEFYDDEIPSYAILSHTWERNQEITCQNCNSDESKSKSGFVKIRKTCELAIRYGFGFSWVDTCCIDKSSSAELTEAINSMFKWYQRAGICFAYLSDLKSGGSLNECRWFTRGWTLQELIAPQHILFFDKRWRTIGDKKTLGRQLSSITKVPPEVLAHDAQLSSFCVARRLSWAAGRKTTRVEDIAYCLLGLFDINMPMLYGEGKKAFHRLQEEIVKTIHDLSIFAWSPPSSMEGDFCGLFANSPNDFASCLDLQVWGGWCIPDENQITLKGQGLTIRIKQQTVNWHNSFPQQILDLGCRDSSMSRHQTWVIPLRKIGATTFIRSRADVHDENSFVPIVCTRSARTIYISITLLTKLPDIYIPRFLSRNQYPNIVSLNRSATVSIEWSPPVPIPVVAQAPAKRWDWEDRVFFSTPSSPENWAAQIVDETFIFVCVWYLHPPGDEWVFEGRLICLQGKTRGEHDRILKELLVFPDLFDYDMSDILSFMRSLDLGDSSRAVTSFDGERFEYSFTVECERDRPEGGTHWTVRISQKRIE